MSSVRVERVKPCPFCTSEDVQTATDYWHYGQYKGEYWFVNCPDCGAHGPMSDTEEDAVRYWNDRPEAEE